MKTTLEGLLGDIMIGDVIQISGESGTAVGCVCYIDQIHISLSTELPGTEPGYRTYEDFVPTTSTAYRLRCFTEYRVLQRKN